MKIIRIIYIIIFALLITAPGVYILYADDAEFSENENRYLQKMPEISAEKFLNKKLQDEFTEYISDQFPGRNTFMQMTTQIKKTAGYKDIGGVYLGSEGYYLEKITDSDIDEKKLYNNVLTAEKFADNYGMRAFIMLVPSSGSVLKQYMPEGASCYDYSAHLDKVSQTGNVLDMYDVMADLAENEQAYYKTDHHWTSRGAYEASSFFKEAAGLNIKEYEYYEPKSVSDGFYGTLYSKVLDKAASPDTMELPYALPEVSVKIEGIKNTLTGIYDTGKLSLKDKYAVFFGGNYGKVTIENSKSTGKNLLVIKDSFANSFVPYLFEDYDTITMIDLRFFAGNVSEALEESGADDMLVLYEMSNFSHDMNFYKVK